MEVKNVEKKIKPLVCISDFTIRFVEKKDMNKIKHKDPATRKKYAHLIKEASLNNYPITLGADKKFPTKNTEKRVLKSIWSYLNLKGNIENFSVFIKDINVKHSSPVSYDFDYSKD